MAENGFLQELRRYVSEHMASHPGAGAEDAVKYVFQAMLGAGHLLPSREKACALIQREMDGCAGNGQEEWTEPLGPFYCRLNLRRALAEGLTADAIAGLMLTSQPETGFTRKDVYDFCRDLKDSGAAAFAEEDLRQICNDSWLPSHSEAYREKYRPAYRVIPARWAPHLPAVISIARKQTEGKRLLITLDGPCASGKTTLAENLAKVFHASVVHTDDYVIPHAQKTPERLAVPGGNCDAERLWREVISPWKRGEKVIYRRYDCAGDCLLPPETLPDCAALIAEGSYINLPIFRREADVRIFLDAPWETRLARLQHRESPESLQRFFGKWIPLENAYFRAYHLPDGDMIKTEGTV